MLRLPWVYSRCLSKFPKMWRYQQLRLQSTTSTGEEPKISSILLSRARSVAVEHARLSTELQTTFDTKIAKRVGELSPTTTALKEWESANDSLKELNALIQEPSSDLELQELASEDLTTTKANLTTLAHALKISLLPRHPFSSLPCLIEIRPGAGGSEAALFASELLSMYVSLCSRNGLQVSILSRDTAEYNSETQLLEAVLEIQTPGSYDFLSTEAGVHRVQRVPATESKGRTHTSAVSVLVLPSFPTNANDLGSDIDYDDPASDYYVNPQDVRTDVMRAKGAGGQHVQKTDSAVRLTHIPTKTVVAMQDSRSQHQNREKAWMLLRARIAQARREEREEEELRLRRSIVGVAKMGRGDKVRTYNFSQGRVTDHRSGMTVYGLQDVLEGGELLEKVMRSVRGWMEERELEALAVEE